jgi:hypothetical protein
MPPGIAGSGLLTGRLAVPVRGWPMPAESLPADHIPALLTEKLIRTHYLPIGARTLARWISCGIFPPADISIGGNTRCWTRDTVERWIGAHLEAAGKWIPINSIPCRPQSRIPMMNSSDQTTSAVTVSTSSRQRFQKCGRTRRTVTQIRCVRANHVLLSCDYKRKVFTAKADGAAVAIALIAFGFAFLIVFLKSYR